MRLSVVLPVHNGMPFLDAAVASIASQTFSDFEFVIGDDGSSDGSSELLREWAARDPRIRLLRRDRPSGPAGSANWVTREAQGEFIARMDADDISHPERLAKQLRVLKDHPTAALAACLAYAVDGKDRVIKRRERHLLFGSGLGAPFPHGSIMFRRSAFDRVGGYRAACQYWEDLDFFRRMAGVGPLLVLPDAEYSYRFSHTSTRLTSQDERVEAGIAFMVRCQDELAAGRSYEALWDERDGSPPAAGPKPRHSPRVFLSIASSRIGSGQRAGMIRRFVRRGAFPKGRADLIALGYLFWASVAPRVLRAFLVRRADVRDRRSASSFPDGMPVEWRY